MLVIQYIIAALHALMAIEVFFNLLLTFIKTKKKEQNTTVISEINNIETTYKPVTI